MLPDFLQFVFYFVLTGAMLKMLQAWVIDKNPESDWGKALSFIY